MNIKILLVISVILNILQYVNLRYYDNLIALKEETEKTSHKLITILAETLRPSIILLGDDNLLEEWDKLIETHKKLS